MLKIMIILMLSRIDEVILNSKFDETPSIQPPAPAARRHARGAIDVVGDLFDSGRCA